MQSCGNHDSEPGLKRFSYFPVVSRKKLHTDFYGAKQWVADDGGGVAWERTRELREATTADCDVRNRLCELEKAP